LDMVSEDVKLMLGLL
jgi:Rrf2 family protein